MPPLKQDGQKHTDSPLTPQEALQLLESAVNYCQLSGLLVRASNAPYLCITIEQARMKGELHHFVLADDVTLMDHTAANTRTYPRSRL